jgi:hypothetical protein
VMFVLHDELELVEGGRGHEKPVPGEVGLACRSSRDDGHVKGRRWPCISRRSPANCLKIRLIGSIFEGPLPGLTGPDGPVIRPGTGV